MVKLSSLALRKWAFYSIAILTTVVLISFQNCGKVKFDANRKAGILAQSCGTISMNPSTGIYPSTNVTFEITFPESVTVSGLAWDFSKGANSVHSSAISPTTYSFDGAGEGQGDYTATATFKKDDGNSCELAQSFQVLVGDLCAAPSGISGPAIAFVGEESSPFSVNAEACFQGTTAWDVDGDGITDYTLPAGDSITHTYTAPGSYTVRGTVINSDDNSQTILTHTIQVIYANCTNGANNPPNCNQCPTGQIYNGTQCIVPGSCNVGGVAMAHGETRNFYPYAVAPCGGTCSTEARTCTNGVVSGNAAYTAVACTAPSCACTNGALNYPTCNACPANQSYVGGQCIPNCTNGTTNPPSCTTCPQNQSLVNNVCVNNCTNGASNPPACTTCPVGMVIIGGQCTVPQNCMVGATQVLHGEARTFYDNSNLGCGAGQSSTCSGQARTCTNGVMSGSTSFTATHCMAVSCPQTCQNGATNPPTCTTCPAGKIMQGGQCVVPAACNVGGVALAHGETRTFYPFNIAPCGQACTGVARTCDNGVPSGNAAYTSPTCTVSQCTACTMDGITVPHGQSRDFFSAASVACGQSCSSASRTCDNGNFTGNAAFNRANCVQTTCNACTLPWGGSIGHGQSATAYQAANVAANATCVSQSRVCNNGTLSGSYTNQACTVDSGGGPGVGGSCPEECEQYAGGTCTSTPVHGGCMQYCSGRGIIYYVCR